MKNIFFVLTIMFLLINTSLAQVEKNYWKREIKGSVLTVIETSFSISKDTTTEIKKGLRTDSTIMSFNDFGNETKEASYSLNGSLSRRSSNRYDIWGNMVQLTGYNPDGSFQWKYDNKYNEKGNQIEADWSNAMGIHNLTRYKYVYDLEGNAIEEIQSDSQGKVFKRITYIYDKAGRVTEYKSYDQDNVMNNHIINAYNINGNKISTSVYTSNGTLFEKTTYTYTYDDKLNWIKRIVFKNDTPYLITERRILY